MHCLHLTDAPTCLAYRATAWLLVPSGSARTISCEGCRVGIERQRADLSRNELPGQEKAIRSAPAPGKKKLRAPGPELCSCGRTCYRLPCSTCKKKAKRYAGAAGTSEARRPKRVCACGAVISRKAHRCHSCASRDAARRRAA